MHTKISTLVTFEKLKEYNLVTIKNKNNMSLNSRVRTWKQNTNKIKQRVQKVSQQKSMIKSKVRKVKC
jgi:LysM repeat protein